MTSPRAALTAALLTAAAASGAAPALAADAPPFRVRAAQSALQTVRAIMAGEQAGDLTSALRELDRRRGALRGRAREAADGYYRRPTNATSEPDADADEAVYDVDEETPFCPVDGKFCVHYVATGISAPDLTDGDDADDIPDYVNRMNDLFEEAYAKEITEFGYTPPKPDGTLGDGAATPAESRIDVYIKEMSASTLGYVQVDKGQTTPDKTAFQVMRPAYDADEIDLKATVAHEFFHVVQNGIASDGDTWLAESTATWMEDQVYPELDQYLPYVADFVTTAKQALPLTSDDKDKKYASAVFFHWIASAQTPATIKEAYSGAAGNEGFAAGALDAALKANAPSQSFGDAFATFSADAAEWRSQPALFSGDGGKYDEMVRRATVLAPDGTGVNFKNLDHTTAAYFDVPGGSGKTLELSGEIGAGYDSALALVGRKADATVVKAVTRMPNGGSGSVTLPAGDYARVTAVLVNADTSLDATTPYDNDRGDWNYLGDDAEFSARVKVPKPAVTPPATTPPATTPPATTPPAITPPSAIAPLLVQAKIAKSLRSSALRKKGLTVTVTPGRTAVVVGTLSAGKKTAKKLGLGSKLTVLAKATKTITGTGKLVLKLNAKGKKAFRRAKAAKLALVLKATSADGAVTTVKRTVSVKR